MAWLCWLPLLVHFLGRIAQNAQAFRLIRSSDVMVRIVLRGILPRARRAALPVTRCLCLAPDQALSVGSSRPGSFPALGLCACLSAACDGSWVPVADSPLGTVRAGGQGTRGSWLEGAAREGRVFCCSRC